MPRPLRPLTPELSPAHRLGAEFREYRRKSTHSQKSLGEVVHVSKSLIGAIEVGERISTAAVIKACDDELGAEGVLCGLWRVAARSRRRAGRPGKLTVVEPRTNAVTASYLLACILANTHEQVGQQALAAHTATARPARPADQAVSRELIPGSVGRSGLIPPG